MVILLIIVVLLFFLYLFLIDGRRNANGMDKLVRYCYAHRGLHSVPDAPENSLAAFKRAAEEGYGAELDVHLLKDGGLAVIHDSDLSRTTGCDGSVEELTASELINYKLEGTEETIPTLTDVLGIFENTAPLVIELKSKKENAAELCKSVCKVLDAYNGDYCIESFDPRCVMWFRKHRPDIIRGQLSQNFIKNPSGQIRIIDFIITSLITNVFTRPDFIAYNFKNRKDLSNFLCTKLLKIKGFS